MESAYVIILAAKDPPSMAVALLHLQIVQDTHKRLSRQARLPQLATLPYVHQAGCRRVFYIFLCSKLVVLHRLSWASEMSV